MLFISPSLPHRYDCAATPVRVLVRTTLTISISRKSCAGTATAIANQDTGISTSVPVEVSGSVKVAGTGSEACGSDFYGSIRLNPTTGALQMCRQ